MSDFLGKLARQTLNMGTQVRPRVPTLFEPTPTRFPLPVAPYASGEGPEGLEARPDWRARDASPRATASRPGVDDAPLSEAVDAVRLAASRVASNALTNAHDMTADTSDVTSGAARISTDASLAAGDEVNTPSTDDAATQRTVRREATARHESEFSSAEGQGSLSLQPGATRTRPAEIARAARDASRVPDGEPDHVTPMSENASTSVRESEAASSSTPARDTANAGASSRRRERRVDDAAPRDYNAARRAGASAAGETEGVNRDALQSASHAPEQEAREGPERVGDFLGNLTARGLGDARAVRPHLSSQTGLSGDAGSHGSDTAAPVRFAADAAAGEGMGAREASGAAQTVEGREAPSLRADAGTWRRAPTVDEVSQAVAEVSKKLPEVDEAGKEGREVGGPLISSRARADVGHESLHEKSRGAQATSDTAHAVVAESVRASAEPPLPRSENSSVRPPRAPQAKSRASVSPRAAESEMAHETAVIEGSEHETAELEAAKHKTVAREMSRRETVARGIKTRAALSAAREDLRPAFRAEEGAAQRTGGEVLEPPPPAFERRAEAAVVAERRAATQFEDERRAAARAAAAERVSAAGHARHVVRPSVAVARTAAVAPQAGSSGEARARQQADGDGPAVVRITIGRVEVRALMPTQTPATAPASQPARTRRSLSLEDYLKERDGGRR